MVLRKNAIELLLGFAFGTVKLFQGWMETAIVELGKCARRVREDQRAASIKENRRERHRNSPTAKSSIRDTCARFAFLQVTGGIESRVPLAM